MEKKLIWCIFFTFMVCAQTAQGFFCLSNETREKDKNLAAEVPKAAQSVTQHQIAIGGLVINYRATIGTLIVRDVKDQPWASMGYIAYAKNDVTDLSRRPITFAYNGGPGCSSIFLHMGALGPKRIVTADAAFTPPPPYEIIDNEYTLLDATDLVMIDPVGTGFSKAIGEATDKDFWAVDKDIESISSFILQYITENGRWNSPKYLLGESYGTTRSAGIADYLQSKQSMFFNGLILVSMATDLDVILDSLMDGGARYHPIIFPLYLPSYSAVAWYHNILNPHPAHLGPFLDEVRSFALGEYAHALALGDRLPESERKTMIEKLHQYTGLSAEYLDKADLKVSVLQFAMEARREYHKTIGQLDGRFLGFSSDPLGEKADYDPMDSATTPAFVAGLLEYIHGELKFGQGKTYIIQQDDVWKTWDYRHKIEGSVMPQPIANTSVDLAHAMTVNPNLRVVVLQGTYDLVSPLLATEYTVSHLDLRKDLQSHVEIKYYDAGHEMYLHKPSLKKFKDDVAAFINRSSKH